MKILLIFLAMASSVWAGALKWERTTLRIDADPKTRDVRVQFPYRNAGRSELRIESVRGVCVCCTAARATKKKLAPGESGEVIVRVDFEKKPLPLAKVVTVQTSDGDTVALTVEVYPKR